jgi:hypothetical protein
MRLLRIGFTMSSRTEDKGKAGHEEASATPHSQDLPGRFDDKKKKKKGEMVAPENLYSE